MVGQRRSRTSLCGAELTTAAKASSSSARGSDRATIPLRQMPLQRFSAFVGLVLQGDGHRIARVLARAPIHWNRQQRPVALAVAEDARLPRNPVDHRNHRRTAPRPSRRRRVALRHNRKRPSAFAWIAPEGCREWADATDVSHGPAGYSMARSSRDSARTESGAARRTRRSIGRRPARTAQGKRPVTRILAHLVNRYETDASGCVDRSIRQPLPATR